MGDHIEAKWGAQWSPGVVVEIVVEEAVFKVRWQEGGTEDDILAKDMRTGAPPPVVIPQLLPPQPQGATKAEALILLDDEDDEEDRVPREASDDDDLTNDVSIKMKMVNNSQLERKSLGPAHFLPPSLNIGNEVEHNHGRKDGE